MATERTGPEVATAEPEGVAREGPVVEDGRELAAGQVHRGQFARHLRRDLHAMVDLELRDTPYSSRECPWIDHYLHRLEAQPLETSLTTLRRWLGTELPATEPALRAAIVGRARAGLRHWRRTGRMPPVPADLGPGPDLSGLIAGIPVPDALRRALDRGVGGVVAGLLRKPEGAGGGVSAHEARSRLGSGRPLDSATRSRFEPSLGALGGVRIHTDTAAAGVASDARASAFTIGKDVGFAAGRWRPGTLAGDALLAHELAHTAQGGGPASTSARGAQLEREADEAAAGAMLGIPGSVRSQGGGLALRRCGDAPPPTLPEYEGAAPTAPPGPTGEAGADLADPAVSAERPLVASFHSGHSWSLPVDANGDQGVDIRLLLHGVGPEDDLSRLTELRVALQGLAADSDSGDQTFDVAGLAFPARMMPTVAALSDGYRNTVVSLATDGTVSLEIGRPEASDTDFVYELVLTHTQGGSAAALQRRTFRLPRESVRHQALFRNPTPLRSVADAKVFDIEIGAFADRFRFTFVQIAPLTVRMGITPLSTTGEAIGGRSFEVFSVPERVSDPMPVAILDDASDLGLHLDVGGDGREDVVVYTAVEHPVGGPDLSRDRRHHFYAHWPGTTRRNPGDSPTWGADARSGHFDVSDGRIQPSGRTDMDLEAVSAAVVADSQQLSSGATTRADFVSKLGLDRTQLRESALHQGLLPESLRDTFRGMEEGMARLMRARVPAPDSPDRPVDPADARRAANDLLGPLDDFAQAFGDASAVLETRDEPVSAGGMLPPPSTYRNAATGRVRTVGTFGTESTITAAHHDVLRAQLVLGAYDDAVATWNRVVRGFDVYVGSLLGEADRARMDALLRLERSVDGLPAEAQPIPAVFHFEGNLNDDGRVFDSPVYLFAWKVENTWHLRNATDPDHTREVEETYSEAGDRPPRSLFEKLDNSRIFPRGMLWYSVPGGHAGHVRCTEPWQWSELLNWIGIGLVVIGAAALIIGSGGTLAPAIGGTFVAVGSVASGLAGVASMIERANVGDWDGTGWALDALQVVGSFAGAAGGFRAVSIGASAAESSSAAVRTALGLSSRGGAFVVTMNAISTGSDVISLVITSGENLRQLEAIDASNMPEDEKTRMRAMLYGSWALNAGLVGLSVYGDVATARQADHLDVVADQPILHTGDIEVPPSAAHLDAGDAPPAHTPVDTPPAPVDGPHATTDGPTVHPVDEPSASTAEPDSPAVHPAPAPTHADASDATPATSSAAEAVDPAPAPADASLEAARARADGATSRLGFTSQADLDLAVTHRATFAATPEADGTWGQAYLRYLDERIGALRDHLADPAAHPGVPRAPLATLQDYWMFRALFREGQRFHEFLQALRARFGASTLDGELRRVLDDIFRAGGNASPEDLKRRVRDALDAYLFRRLGLGPSTDPVEVARMNQEVQDAIADMGPNDRGRIGERWRALRHGGETHEQVTVGREGMRDQGATLVGDRRLDNIEVDPSLPTQTADDLEALGGFSDDVLDAVGDAPVTPVVHVEVKSGGVSDLDQLRDHVRLVDANGGRGALLHTGGEWVRVTETAVELQRPGILRDRPSLLQFFQDEFLRHANTRVIVFDGGRMIEVRGPLAPGTSLLAILDAAAGP